MAERRFDGKVAIVTGGALGMGRTSARRFAQEGAKVCVVDIDAWGAEDTARVIREDGGEAFACAADISLEADNDRMVDEVLSRYHRLDLANLNAAILGEVTDFFASTTANFDRVVAVNQRGCYLGLKSVGRVMQPEGAIVVMSSLAGLAGWDQNAAYTAAKHAVIGLVRSATPAFAARRIRVNVICPGTVNTRMFVENPEDEPLSSPSALKMAPFRGLGKTQQIAELVLFLASSAASFVTGAVLTADGGMTSTL